MPSYILYPTLAVGLTLLFYAFHLHHFTSAFSFFSFHDLMFFQLDFLNRGCEVVEVLVLTDPQMKEFVFLACSGFGLFLIIFTFCIDYFQITVFCNKLNKCNSTIPPRSFLKDSSCFATKTFGCAGLIDPSSLGHFYCFNIFQIGLANPEVCLKPFIIVCLLVVAAFPRSQSN